MEGNNQHIQSPPAERESDSSTPATRNEIPSSTPPTVPGTEVPGGQRSTCKGNDERVEEDGKEVVDPRSAIPDYDWEDLEQRYHDMIKQQGEKEQGLYDDFASLVEYFTVWANTTHNHEVDRSYKRLKTRMHHVQNSEVELEKKRLHYIKVVNAFESALRLLND